MTPRSALRSTLRLIKRGLRALLRAVGLEVRRIPTRPTATGDGAAVAPAYDISPSCQVPNLSFLYETYFGRRPDGTCVEVGAYDGISFSNTSGLIAAGWSAWLVEPVPSSAARCRERYSDRPGVVVDQLAVSDRRGELVIVEGGALSTADPETLDEYRTIDWAMGQFDGASPTAVRVRCLPLDDYLDERGVDPGFDLLVVDVEGHEAAVFAGFDLDRWSPTMVIVELADNHPDLVSSRSAHAQLLLQLVDAGYVIAYKDAINTVFVTREVYRSALVRA